MAKIIKLKKKTFRKKPLRMAKPSKALVKTINSVIHKDVETKDASYTMGVTNFNSGVNNVADVLRIIPTIQTGTSNGQRIGDNILTQRMDVRGHIMINTVFNTTGVTIPTAIPNTARMKIGRAHV